jgi:hypothetical protein
MTTLVYPVGHGRGDLLRYSLRSVACASPAVLPDVVLVGECPDYINPAAVTYLASSQAFGPFVNVWVAWQRTAAALGADTEWWWMNDDFFVTAESLGDALIDAHRGPLDAFCAALDGKPGVGPWRRRARATGGLLGAHGYVSPMSWEAHRPMRAAGADVLRAAAALARYGMKGADVAQRTLIATIGGREGTHLADPKRDERGEDAWWFEPLTSTGPRAWAGPLGERIRYTFPNPSPWERT